jgi:hypothetical protein
LAQNFEKGRLKNGVEISSGETPSIEPVIKPRTVETDSPAKNSADEAGDYWVTENVQVWLLVISHKSILYLIGRFPAV